MPKRGYCKPVVGDATDPEGLLVWSRRYLDHVRVRAYSPWTMLRKTEQHYVDDKARQVVVLTGVRRGHCPNL